MKNATKPAIVIIPSEESLQKEEEKIALAKEEFMLVLKEEDEIPKIKEEPVLVYGGKIEAEDLDYKPSLVLAKKTKLRYLKFGIPASIATIIALYFYDKKLNDGMMLGFLSNLIAKKSTEDIANVEHPSRPSTEVIVPPKTKLYPGPFIVGIDIV